MDYALVGAAAERQFGGALFENERSFDEDIKIWKDLTEMLVREHFLVCETGVAPDGLAGFFLYAAGKFGESLDLIERVAAGKCDIGEFIFLDYIKERLNGHLLSSVKGPGLRIMTARTMVGAACAVD